MSSLGRQKNRTDFNFGLYVSNKFIKIINFSAAYKDNYVAMIESENIRGKAIKPNMECLDGYIHLIDTVMIDDSPPWAVGGTAIIRKNSVVVILTSILSFNLLALIK